MTADVVILGSFATGANRPFLNMSLNDTSLARQSSNSIVRLCSKDGALVIQMG